MVVPRGNAPRSPAYQAGALLLSYRTEIESGGICLRSPLTFSRAHRGEPGLNVFRIHCF
jgi:hypothetical protein